jgi:hypothetical protein
LGIGDALEGYRRAVKNDALLVQGISQEMEEDYDLGAVDQEHLERRRTLEIEAELMV